jgi:hypothetical protein
LASLAAAGRQCRHDGADLRRDERDRERVQERCRPATACVHNLCEFLLARRRRVDVRPVGFLIEPGFVIHVRPRLQRELFLLGVFNEEWIELGLRIGMAAGVSFDRALLANV